MNQENLLNLKSSKGLRNTFLFHLEGVSVNFGTVHALKNVSLTINPGEVLFITGKSGAGKTTLLNILAGDINSKAGKILSPDQKTVFTSQVFQDLRLMENVTCEENLWVSYDSKIYKNKNEYHQDMMELCNVLGVKDYLNVKIKDANGGLKQKVAMIRALLSKPQVLLADEPTAALDKESAMKLFEILNFYNVRRNLTVVWASHNRDLVKQFPGKIVHLDGGKLIYSGHACFI
jgi:ABC-type multidrug transport system ATPase subunit